MTYFDKKTYNYNNLKKEDKRLVNIFDYAIEDMEAYFDNKVFEYDNTTLDKIKKEICEEIKEELKDWMETSKLEVIVSLIDDYEE